MHAYLIVGTDPVAIDAKINQLVKMLGAQALEFPLKKISDVRSLQSYAKLSLNKPQALIIKNIDAATIEALSAFLKNLEEPQQNLKYILTAESTHNQLQTIVSRCQVIRVDSGKLRVDSENAENFLKMSQEVVFQYVHNNRQRQR